MSVVSTIVCCCCKWFGGCRPVAYYLKPTEPLPYCHCCWEQAPHHIVYATGLQQLTNNHIIPLRDECSKTLCTAPMTPLIAIEKPIFDEQGLSRVQIHRRRIQTSNFATYTPCPLIIWVRRGPCYMHSKLSTNT